MSQLSHQFPDATLEELESYAANQLLAAPANPNQEYITRECRDCGNEFKLLVELANRQTKWCVLCPSCLRWEI